MYTVILSLNKYHLPCERLVSLHLGYRIEFVSFFHGIYILVMLNGEKLKYAGSELYRIFVSIFVYIILNFAILIIYSHSYLVIETFCWEVGWQDAGRDWEGLKWERRWIKLTWPPGLFLVCTCSELLVLWISNLSHSWSDITYWQWAWSFS